MADNSLVVTDLSIELAKFNTQFATAIRLGRDFDLTMKDAVKDLNVLAEQMNKLQAGGLDLVVNVDPGDLDTVQSDVDSLDGQQINVQVNTNAQELSQVTRTVQQLDGGSADIKVTATEQGLTEVTSAIETIDSATPVVDVTVGAETDTAKSEIASIDDALPAINIVVTADTETAASEVAAIDDTIPTVDVTVTADTTQATSDLNTLDTLIPSNEVINIDAEPQAANKDIQAIKDKLDNIQKLSVINLVVNAAGAIESIQNVANSIPGVKSTQDLNEAMRLFAAQTGKEITGVSDIVNNVFNKGLADSKQQVAEVAADFTKYGVDITQLGDATEGAFNASVATGKDVTEIVPVMDTLVKNFGISYKDASDLIVSGSQEGADRAGDLLGTLQEFSPQFASAGVSAASALDLIKQGLDAGTFNASKLGDTFKEMNLKVTEAVNTGSGGTFDTLQKLGLFDEAQAYKAGEITGTQFADAAVKAAAEKGNDTDLVGIFGTPLEDFGTSIFKGLNFQGAADAIIPPDAAQTAADTMTDTFSDSITELKRTVETELADSFRIAGMPLTQVLDDAKDKIQNLSSLIQSGKSIPDALEIVLQAPGLSLQIQSFEASIGNFILDLMSAIADAQQALNIGDKGANLRERVKEGATQQFAYDVQVTNPDQIQSVISRAISRGVDTADISKAFTTATDELISQGDVDRAQEILFAINAMPKASAGLTQPGSGSVRVPFTLEPGQDADQAAKLAVDKFILEHPEWAGSAKLPIQMAPEIDTTAAHEVIDDTLTLIDAGMQKLQVPGQIIAAPFQAIQSAIQTPGVQTMAQNAYTGAALEKSKTASQGGIDWSNPANAILPPVVADDTTATVSAMGDATGNLSTDVVANFDTIKENALQTFGTDIPEATDDTNLGFQKVVVSTDDLLVNGGARLDEFTAKGVTNAGLLANAWAAVATTIAGESTGIPTAPGTTSTTDTPVVQTSGGPAGATGGPQTGWTQVGEEGPELANFGQSGGSVLNNQTFSKILDAMQAVIGGIGGGGGGSSTVNNFNINVTNNNKGMAARAGSDTRLASAVRGF